MQIRDGVTIEDCNERLEHLYRSVCNLKIDHENFTQKFMKTKNQKYAAKALNAITNIKKYNYYIDRWIEVKKELENDK